MNGDAGRGMHSGWLQKRSGGVFPRWQSRYAQVWRPACACAHLCFARGKAGVCERQRLDPRRVPRAAHVGPAAACCMLCLSACTRRRPVTAARAFLSTPRPSLCTPWPRGSFSLPCPRRFGLGVRGRSVRGAVQERGVVLAARAGVNKTASNPRDLCKLGARCVRDVSALRLMPACHDVCV